MADNYLEKKMDDYRRGVIPARRPGLRRGHASIPWPAQTVLLEQLPPDLARRLTELLNTAGCKVIYTAATDHIQGCGARFYPADDRAAMLAHMAGRAESIDVVIAGEGADTSDIRAAKTILLGHDIIGGDTVSQALAIMLAAHRDVDLKGPVRL